MRRLRKNFMLGTFVGACFLLSLFIYQLSFATNDFLSYLGNRLFSKKSDKIEESEKRFKRQFDVKQNIKDVCKRLARNETLLSDNQIGLSLLKFRSFSIFVDDQHQLLYCAVPKVASTSWERVLLFLTGKMNVSDPGKLHGGDVHGRLQQTYLKRLNRYNESEIRYRLENYFKFVFVREPFERLLSAYRSKFALKNKFFLREYGRKIVKLYRTSPNNESLVRGDDVRFEEFVRYLVDRGLSYNQHWESYHKICHPCYIQYDFIGKYETLKEDVDFVLSRIGVNGLVRFPDSTSGLIRGEKTSDVLVREFANVSDADIHRLRNLYSTDFALFGYGYPRFSTNATN